MPSIPWLRTSGLAVAVLCLPACSEEPAGYLVQFGLSSNRARQMRDPIPPPDHVFASSDGIDFHVDSIFVRLSEIRLELPPDTRCADQEDLLSPRTTCEDATGEHPGRLTLSGPIRLNLLYELALSDGEERGWQRIPRGVYPRIEARLDPGTPTNPTFSSRSSFTWGNMSRVLEANFQSDAVLRFEPPAGEGPLDFAPAKDGSSLVGWMPMDPWLEEVPVAHCLASGDLPGVSSIVSLDSGQGECAGAADRMKARFEAGGVMRLISRP